LIEDPKDISGSFHPEGQDLMPSQTRIKVK